MEGFKSYLLSRRMVTEKKVVFYLHWVARFYSFCSKQIGEHVHQEEIDGFLNQLSKVSFCSNGNFLWFAKPTESAKSFDVTALLLKKLKITFILKQLEGQVHQFRGMMNLQI